MCGPFLPTLMLALVAKNAASAYFCLVARTSRRKFWILEKRGAGSAWARFAKTHAFTLSQKRRVALLLSRCEDFPP